MGVGGLRERQEWKFFGVLPKADRTLAIVWWVVLVLRGVLPAVFAIAMGVLVAAVQRGDSLAGPLAFVGCVFVLLQVLTPIHQAVSANLGDRTAAWLYDRLTEACVRPPGMGHLEDPTAHQRSHGGARFRPRHDRSAAVDLHGLHRRRPGRDDRRPRLRRRALRLRLVGAARARRRLAGDALAAARERGLARPQHRRSPRRAARRGLRLPARRRSAAGKELRLFGLADWTIDRFVTRRTRLHALQYEATRLREQPVLWSLLLVIGANVVVFWSLASAAGDGTPEPGADGRVRPERGRHVDDRVRRAQLGARRRRRRRSPPCCGSSRRWPPAGALPAGTRPAAGMPAREIRFRNVTFAYPGGAGPRPLRSHDSCRLVARHRRPERRRQDHAGQAAVPAVRPAIGRDRDRRRRSARPRRWSRGAIA